MSDTRNMIHQKLVRELPSNARNIPSVIVRYLTTEDLSHGTFYDFFDKYGCDASTPLQLDRDDVIGSVSDYWGYYIGAFTPDYTMVGICSLGGPEGVFPEADGTKDVVLSDLYILPEYRGLKIGSALVSGAAEIALREHGSPCLIFLSPLSDRLAYGFYKPLGFRVYGDDRPGWLFSDDGMSCEASRVARLSLSRTDSKEVER